MLLTPKLSNRRKEVLFVSIILAHCLYTVNCAFIKIFLCSSPLLFPFLCPLSSESTYFNAEVHLVSVCTFSITFLPDSFHIWFDTIQSLIRESVLEAIPYAWNLFFYSTSVTTLYWLFKNIFAFLFHMCCVFLSKPPANITFLSRLLLSFLFLCTAHKKMQTSQIPASHFLMFTRSSPGYLI